MIKIKKKWTGLVSIALAFAVGASASVGYLLLNKGETTNSDEDIKNSLNRDKSYQKYSLSQLIVHDKEIKNIVLRTVVDNAYVYVVKEELFISGMKDIVRNVLKTIPKFAQNYNLYVIECNYKIVDHTISVDLVWYLTQNRIKYFDQFELNLNIF